MERVDPRCAGHRMLEQRSVNSRVINGKDLFYTDLPRLPMPDNEDAVLFIQFGDLFIIRDGQSLLKHCVRSSGIH